MPKVTYNGEKLWAHQLEPIMAEHGLMCEETRSGYRYECIHLVHVPAADVITEEQKELVALYKTAMQGFLVQIEEEENRTVNGMLSSIKQGWINTKQEMPDDVEQEIWTMLRTVRAKLEIHRKGYTKP